MPSADVDLTCEDCGHLFPRLLSVGGKCKRCAIADTKVYRSPEWEQVMSYPQCVGCGTSAKNMMPPRAGAQQTCDAVQCVELFAGAPTASGPPVTHELPHTISQRSASLFESLQGSQNQGAGSHVHTGSALTTESLQARENIMRANANIASGKKVDSIIVELKYRKSDSPKRVNDTYGASKLPMPSNSTLYDVQDYAVDQYNIVHTKKGARKPILVSETLLRQSDNRTIDNNKMGFTLRKWLDLQISEGLIALPTSGGASAKPGAKKVAPASLKPVLAFELFVLQDMYDERMERMQMPAPIESTFAGGHKRRDRTGSILETSAGPGPSKVARSAGHDFGIGSSFSLMRQPISNSGPTVSSTKVHAMQIKCSTSPQGDPIFENRDHTTVFLADRPFAKGSMKAVFEIVLPYQAGNRYVAKRFFKLQGSSDESVQDGLTADPSRLVPTSVRIPKVSFGVQEHNKWIQLECAKLFQGRAFLKAFKKFCSEEGVFIFQHLRFARAYLLQETGAEASPASGMSSEDRDWLLHFAPISGTLDDKESGFMWMVEKRHTSSRVQRFSGTLKHPSESTDLLPLTIYAFNHYSYGHSNGEMVFADLQGTPSSFKQENGDTVEGFQLFDPMTHTITQCSGIGDFGEEGINTFLQQHQCREICTMLGLDKSVPLTPIAEKSPSTSKKPLVDHDSDDEEEDEGKGKGKARATEAD